MENRAPGRIAGLDGLRGLSVLAVFLFHTGIAGVGGGFVGVDVFFVLSGFLITGLLVKEHTMTGTIDLLAFYFRRMRRLYPALLAVLAAIALYLFVFEPELRAPLEILPALLYVMNWVRALGLYDAVMTAHTWSLAIEEQFYLLWPIVLLSVAKFSRRRALISLGIVAVAIVCWREWLYYSRHVQFARVYTGFDTHTDGLIIGAFMALMPPKYLQRVGHLWPVGLAYLFGALFLQPITGFAIKPVGYAPSALASALLIARIASAQSSRIVSVLELPPLARFGKVSYGFYLWHYPVVHVMLYGGHRSFGAFFGSLPFPNPALIAASFLISLGLTVASWTLVEKPAMRLRFRYGPRACRQAVPEVQS